MKPYKSLLIATAVIGGMLASCSDEGYWDQVSKEGLGLAGGSTYAFNTSSASYVYYPADNLEGSDIEVTITRGNTQGAAELTITGSLSDSTLMSGPSSVSFADGSSTAAYTIHFSRDLEIGESVSASLVIDTLALGIPKVEMPAALDETATAADSAKFKTDSIAYVTYLKKLANYKLATKVSIMKDYNWQSLGKGKFIEGFWFENVDDPADVEIMQAVENKNIFRLVNPWEAVMEAIGEDPSDLDGNQTNLQFRILQQEELYGETVINEDLVYFEPSNTGYYYSTYGADVWLLHPAEFSNTGTEEYWLHNKVLKYQENGLPAQIQLAPRYYMYGVGGWNYSQEDGLVLITFPGVKSFDYSADIAYAGMFTDVDNTVYVLADLDLSGADAAAATAKAVICSQDTDAEAIAEAILTGDLEAETVEAGRLQMVMPKDLSGKLQIVVAIIDIDDDGNDEVKNAVSAKFDYYGGSANPWEIKGCGDYLYTLFFTNEDGSPYNDEGLELQYNAEEDTYRITNWGYGVDFTFMFDESTNEVNVPVQGTGYTTSKYGPVYVQESDDYAGDEGWDDDDDGVQDPYDGPSYYDPETQTFHFNVAYFVSAGYFCHGEETFTLTADAARSLKAYAKKSLSGNAKLQLHKATKKANRSLRSKKAAQKVDSTVRPRS